MIKFSAGDFRVLQLIVLAVFGAMNYPLTFCMLVHLFENLVWNDGEFVSLT